MIGLFCSSNIIKNHKIITRNWFRSMINVFGKDNVVLIYNGKSCTRFKNLIGIDDVIYESFYLYPNKNWKDLYEDCEDILNKHNITNLICFRITSVNKANNESLYLYDTFDRKYSEGNYEYSTKFNVINKLYSKYLFIKVAADLNIQIIQFATDTQEPNLINHFNLSDNNVRGYILNKLNDNSVYLPSCEYEYVSNRISRDKLLDFVFYGTAVTEDREYLLDLNNLDIPYSDILIVSTLALAKKSKAIPQNDYLELVAKSKFTLIAPSYDSTTFSMLRFFEAIQRGCVPLVLTNCDLSDLRNTYPDICDIVEKYLLVDISRVADKIEELMPLRDNIILQLFGSESIKKLSDLDYYKSEWNRYLK